jgi:hypothetical protein
MSANLSVNSCEHGVRKGIASTYRLAMTKLSDDRPVQIDARFGANVFDAVFPVVAEVVVAEAIHFGVDDLVQDVLQFLQLSRVNKTLKDRVLHTLTVVLAFLRDLTQARLPGFGFGFYVVGDEDEHLNSLSCHCESGGYWEIASSQRTTALLAMTLVPKEWRVGVEVAAQVTRQ